MSTLLLRLSAPLQSWGAAARNRSRPTGLHPTVSGVCGMVAYALGWEEGHDLSDLAALRFGSRADRPGRVVSDFQFRAKVPGVLKDPILTHRSYLADAGFLVGIEAGDRPLLDALAQALTQPARTVFLGRKNCPPTAPLVVGIRDTDLATALAEEPPVLLGDAGGQRAAVVIDLDAAPGDVPLSLLDTTETPTHLVSSAAVYLPRRRACYEVAVPSRDGATVPVPAPAHEGVRLAPSRRRGPRGSTFTIPRPSAPAPAFDPLDF